jgi:hypothetical protein
MQKKWQIAPGPEQSDCTHEQLT